MNEHSYERLLAAAGTIALALGTMGSVLVSYGCFLPYRLSRFDYEVWTLSAKVSMVSLTVALAIGVFTLAIAKHHSIAVPARKSDPRYKRIVRLASLAIVASLVGTVIWLFLDNVHSTAPAFPLH